jgi:hypothetical protein
MSDKPRLDGLPESVGRVRELFPGIPRVHIPPWALTKEGRRRPLGEPHERLTMLADAWNYEASKLTPSAYSAVITSIARLRERHRIEEDELSLRREVIEVLGRIARQIARVVKLHGPNATAGNAAPPASDGDPTEELVWEEAPRWLPVANGGLIPDPPEDLPVRGYYLRLYPLLERKDPRTREYFGSVYNRQLDHIDASQTWGEALSEVSEHLKWEQHAHETHARVRDQIAFRVSLLEHILQEYDLFGYVRALSFSPKDVEEASNREMSRTVEKYCRALVGAVGSWVKDGNKDRWVADEAWLRGTHGHKTATDLFGMMALQQGMDAGSAGSVRTTIKRWREGGISALGHEWPATSADAAEFVPLAEVLAPRFAPVEDRQDMERTA